MPQEHNGLELQRQLHHLVAAGPGQARRWLLERLTKAGLTRHSTQPPTLAAIRPHSTRSGSYSHPPLPPPWDWNCRYRAYPRAGCLAAAAAAPKPLAPLPVICCRTAVLHCCRAAAVLTARQAAFAAGVAALAAAVPAPPAAAARDPADPRVDARCSCPAAVPPEVQEVKRARRPLAIAAASLITHCDALLQVMLAICTAIRPHIPAHCTAPDRKSLGKTAQQVSGCRHGMIKLSKNMASMCHSLQSSSSCKFLSHPS
jgi:hypothetical protein